MADERNENLREDEVLNSIADFHLEHGSVPIQELQILYASRREELEHSLTMLELKGLISRTHNSVTLSAHGLARADTSSTKRTRDLAVRLLAYLTKRALAERSLFQQFTWNELLAASVVENDGDFSLLIHSLFYLRLCDGGTSGGHPASASWGVPRKIADILDLSTFEDIMRHVDRDPLQLHFGATRADILAAMHELLRDSPAFGPPLWSWWERTSAKLTGSRRVAIYDLVAAMNRPELSSAQQKNVRMALASCLADALSTGTFGASSPVLLLPVQRVVSEVLRIDRSLGCGRGVGLLEVFDHVDLDKQDFVHVVGVLLDERVLRMCRLGEDPYAVFIDQEEAQYLLRHLSPERSGAAESEKQPSMVVHGSVAIASGAGAVANASWSTANWHHSLQEVTKHPENIEPLLVPLMKLIGRAIRETGRCSSEPELSAALQEATEIEEFRAAVRTMPDSPAVETAKAVLGWLKDNKPLWGAIFGT